MASLQELLAQKAAIEKQIVETQRQERTEAITRVRELMAQYGLSAADIAGRPTPAPRRATAEARKVAPKYRNPDTGETWSGRGLQPKWLKAALAAGRKIEDFAL